MNRLKMALVLTLPCLLVACSSGSSSGGGSETNVSALCIERSGSEFKGTDNVKNVCDFDVNIGRIVDDRLKDVSALGAGQTTTEVSEFKTIACRAPSMPTAVDSCS